MAEETRKLTLPNYDEVEFPSNYVRVAVVELRFPTILELETKPPVAFQRALRKEYPLYEKQPSLDVSPGSVEAGETRYLFKSKKQDWIVSLRASAVALEVRNYSVYGEFRARLERVVTAAKDFIDSDFFTRVGLRYVNVVPLKDNSVEGIINTSLTKPLEEGTYGTVNKFWQEVRGSASVGSYSFRHGLPENQTAPVPGYVLDFDMAEDNVEVGETMGLLDHLHQQNYNFFRWALGERALMELGSPQRTVRS